MKNLLDWDMEEEASRLGFPSASGACAPCAPAEKESSRDLF